MDATLAATPVLVALEIDDAVALLGPAAAEARRDLARCCCGRRCASCPSTSDFSGVCLVMSSRDTTVVKRRDGVIGLILLHWHGILYISAYSGIFLARLQPHVGLLPVGAVAGKTSPAAQLACRKWQSGPGPL